MIKWIMIVLIALNIVLWILRYFVSRRQKYWEERLRISTEALNQASEKTLMIKAERILLDEQIRVAIERMQEEE